MFSRLVIGLLLSSLVAFSAGAAPQPVVIQTQVTFVPLAEGTFTASAPLCSSGTFRAIHLVSNPSVAHGWMARHEYTCDDNSGSFVLQLHPHATTDPAFTVAGPWSVLAGTGRYAKLSGHGDFGVVIDFNQDPWTGEESFVGFVQFHE